MLNLPRIGNIGVRSPLASDKILELDGVRALSITFVLLVHISYGHLQGGFLGVDIFFVLSGYLITSLLLRELEEYGSIDLRNFYVRRALRILPPLVAACILGLTLATRGSEEGVEGLRVVTAVLLFHSNFIAPSSLGNLAHTWSLAVEEQFYLVWPLLLLYSHRFSRSAPVLVACAIIVMSLLMRDWMSANPENRTAIYTFTFARIDTIIVGCLLALLESKLIAFYEPRRSLAGCLASISAILLIAALIFATQDYMEATPIGFSLFAFNSATFIFAIRRTAQNKTLRKALRHPLTAWLGQRSYGLYLYHYPIFGALEALRIPGDLLNYGMVSALKLVLSLAFAEFAWRFLERPVLSLKSKFPARPPIHE